MEGFLDVAIGHVSSCVCAAVSLALRNLSTSYQQKSEGSQGEVSEKDVMEQDMVEGPLASE